jgi:DNA polymerase
MIISGDFETRYDQQYSLSKMSEVDYILDHRFQSIMCAIKVDDKPSEVFIGHDAIARKLSTFDWSKCAWLSHNTRFDGSILAWRYGIEPALYLDTLSMARATTHWTIGRSSLKHLSDYLGLPPKGDEVVRAIGKRLEDFTPSELDAYADYCIRDNDNCYDIFNIMRPLFQTSELRLIDLFLRMFIIPQVKLDPNVLAEYLQQVRADKETALAKVSHIDKSVFSSNQKFNLLLESMGVDVPLKVSPTTGLEIPALAKNDREFRELCMDASLPTEVQAVLAARMGAKSTIEETRAQKLLDLSLREWPDHTTSWAPVPLKHYGARTGRPSGDSGLNWLNFKRGAMVRHAIVAPAGYRIVHRDASQIEARMVAWLAGCKVLIDAFAAGRDVYSEFASIVFGRPVTKANALERFIGKTGILGLGYGCGWEKFRHMLFIGSGGMSHNASEDEAKAIVRTYRKAYPQIPDLWAENSVMLARIIRMSRPTSTQMMRQPPPWKEHLALIQLETVITPGFDALHLPNGMCICYPNIRFERNPSTNTFEMVYNNPYGSQVKIYGAKATENISQALARIVVTDSAVRMYDLTGYHPFLTTYDSLDYCVPEADAPWFDRQLEREFATRPSWAPDLPLASEGGYGRSLLIAENDKHPEHNR